jgi:methionyl aminopeptidase
VKHSVNKKSKRAAARRASGGASRRPVSVARQQPAEAPRPPTVAPGQISPMRMVPLNIPRPDYAATGRPPSRFSSNVVKTPEQIARMRRAATAAREVLDEIAPLVRPGVTTEEIDAACHEAYIKRGGYPSTLNYQGYPKSLCTSVNEVICHGIPDSRALREGDIVNLDVTIFLDGMHGDCSATFPVGEVDDESSRLVEVTRESMWRGIEAVQPGQPINRVGRAIQLHAEANGFGVVRAFVGHGIGEVFHMEPSVPHFFDPDARTVMRPGMTFTIEPMITVGDWRHTTWPDGWTAVTVDRRRTAQFEHTILVTDTGVDVLTAWPDEVAARRRGAGAVGE